MFQLKHQKPCHTAVLIVVMCLQVSFMHCTPDKPGVVQPGRIDEPSKTPGTSSQDLRDQIPSNETGVPGIPFLYPGQKLPAVSPAIGALYLERAENGAYFLAHSSTDSSTPTEKFWISMDDLDESQQRAKFLGENKSFIHLDIRPTESCFIGICYDPDQAIQFRFYLVRYSSALASLPPTDVSSFDFPKSPGQGPLFWFKPQFSDYATPTQSEWTVDRTSISLNPPTSGPKISWSRTDRPSVVMHVVGDLQSNKPETFIWGHLTTEPALWFLGISSNEAND